MRVVIFGSTSLIAKELNTLYSKYEIFNIDRNHNIFLEENFLSKCNIFRENDIIVYLSSILQQKRIEDQTYSQIFESCKVNAILPIRIIKYLNKNIKRFTFCYVSSESAKKGSFDDSYSIFKAAVDNFIREFYLISTDSRIFSIAPSTINSGMTLGRKDVDRVEFYKNSHRKKRFIEVNEFAKIIAILCSEEFTYLSNTSIEINGGKFARNKY